MNKQWSIEKTQEWEKKQPWFFGANFIPSTAINQLEMWQKETFDPATIHRELGFAQRIGMNIMRVYLHDLLWEHDCKGFIEHIEQYLNIADTKNIKTIFVLFDDCWNGQFALGLQPDPVPYTHNSGWLQSPGHSIAEDSTQWPRLEKYVKELLQHFKLDERIVAWDLYNEPGNGEEGDANDGFRRGDLSVPLLVETFAWARTVAGLTQPLTAGIWSPQEKVNRCLLENSDIISFHSYSSPEKGLQKQISQCQQHRRPVICTEYMARSNGSTFANCTLLLKEQGIGAINWGLVSGKTQTIYPWGWNKDKGRARAFLPRRLPPRRNLLVS